MSEERGFALLEETFAHSWILICASENIGAPKNILSVCGEKFVVVVSEFRQFLKWLQNEKMIWWQAETMEILQRYF